ncbi:MAG: hypothetical protein PHC56_10255 [Herbinix sp.]|nr:hypothetical protein [Herbinix sp.]
MGEAIQTTMAMVLSLLPWLVISYPVSKKILRLNMRKKIWSNIIIFLIIYSVFLIAVSFLTPYWKLEYDPDEKTIIHQLVDRGLQYLLYVICTLLMINEKWYYSVLYAISSYYMYYMIILLLIYVIETPLLIFQIKALNTVLDIIFIVFFLVLLIITILTLKKDLQRSNMIKLSNLSKKEHTYIYTLIYMNTKIFGAIVMLYGEENILNNIISIIYFIIILIQLFALIYLINVRIILKERHSLNQDYLKLQEEHYQSIMEKDLKLRKLRHDMKHHLYILRMLNEEGKQGEMSTYLNSIRIASL